jgi:hypothetical protein
LAGKSRCRSGIRRTSNETLHNWTYLEHFLRGLFEEKKLLIANLKPHP